jgi:hypothetical protein
MAEPQEHAAINECYFPKLAFTRSEADGWETFGRDLCELTPNTLQEACARISTSLPEVLKTAWALTLARYAGTASATFRVAEVTRNINVESLVLTQWDESMAISKILKEMNATKEKEGKFGCDDDAWENFCSQLETRGRNVVNTAMLLVEDEGERAQKARAILQNIPEVSKAKEISESPFDHRYPDGSYYRLLCSPNKHNGDSSF